MKKIIPIIFKKIKNLESVYKIVDVLNNGVFITIRTILLIALSYYLYTLKTFNFNEFYLIDIIIYSIFSLIFFYKLNDFIYKKIKNKVEKIENEIEALFKDKKTLEKIIEEASLNLENSDFEYTTVILANLKKYKKTENDKKIEIQKLKNNLKSDIGDFELYYEEKAFDL